VGAESESQVANNIAFQPMGKTTKVIASSTANTVTLTADSPVNQYLVVNHEKTNGTGFPVYVRISATSSNAVLPTGYGENAAYSIPIPPGTMFVFTGPQCSSTTSVYFSAISENDAPDIYVTPGEGL
jgi:hypothetical protein